jgi:hypothetical protein
MVWPAIVFFSSPTTLRRYSIAVIAIDMIFRFTVSMWSPELPRISSLDLPHSHAPTHWP